MTHDEQRPWRATARAVEGESLSSDSIAPAPLDEGPIEAAGRPPEAAESPEGTVTLARALSELAAILPGLRQALESRQAARPEPLAYRKADAASMCGMSVRLWERLLSAGKAPKPDAHAGRCPLWTRATLERWLAQGGGRI
jgi:hypothetical protein